MANDGAGVAATVAPASTIDDDAVAQSDGDGNAPGSSEVEKATDKKVSSKSVYLLDMY